MNLMDVLHRLRSTGRERERAARDLLAWLRAAARRAPAELREEVVDSVAFKVVERVSSGDALAWQEPAGYLRAMIKNRTSDLLDARRREAPLEAAPEPAAPEEEPDPTPARHQRLASLRRALDRLFGSWQEASPRRYRAPRQVAYRQLCAAVFERRALSERAAEERPADPRAAKRALDAAYKAHQRLREGLAGHLRQLESRGRLPPGEAEHLRQALDLLVRAGVRSAGAGSLERRGSQT